jgi:hypothetical protein
MDVMKIRIVAAGAAMFAGLIMGTPAWAICLPLWGTVCRAATIPSADAATTPGAKPHKPLNLRAVAHKDGKGIRVAADRRTRIATRHRQPVAAKQATAAKQASRNIVTARAHVAAARRLAAARRRPVVEARRQAVTREAPKEAVKTPAAFREQVAQVVAAVASSATTNGTASPPQTDGYVPSQNEVTELDRAADQPKVPPPAPEAPNPALWNAVTPTDPAANAGVVPSADAAKVAPANNQKVVPTNDQVASADPANPVEVASPAPQQPADEPSWLRRIMIGLGGVLTLASAVRLFAG